MKQAVALWLTLGLLVLCAPAMAGELPISGSVAGSFGTGSNQLLSGSNETLLTYTGGTFSATLSDDQTATVDLGTITVYSTDRWWKVKRLEGIPFSLSISFTNPDGVDIQTFDATVVGFLTCVGAIVGIDFEDAGTVLSLNNGTGAFSFRVNDAVIGYLGSEGEMSLSASARLRSFDEHVPEPVAYEILGAGLAGAVLLLSRRRSRLSRKV